MMSKNHLKIIEQLKSALYSPTESLRAHFRIVVNFRYDNSTYFSTFF